MSQNLSRSSCFTLLAVIMLAAPVFAGEADFEPADIHEHGNPYFGEAKDIKGLSPVENVRIKVQVKGTQRFFIVQTDGEGRFRRNGLGTDVDPEKVEFFCDKDGFRTVEVMPRRCPSYPSRSRRSTTSAAMPNDEPGLSR